MPALNAAHANAPSSTWERSSSRRAEQNAGSMKRWRKIARGTMAAGQLLSAPTEPRCEFLLPAAAS